MSRKNLFAELMEAVAFAEAGETEAAQRIAVELFPSDAGQKGRVVALSRTAGFSRRMIEKSLGVAERLDYGLVALSVPPATKLMALLEGRRSQEWRTADDFRAEAQKRGVPFLHTVHPGDPEEGVAWVCQRVRRIAFLLIEPTQLPKVHFASISVPIFSVTDE